MKKSGAALKEPETAEEHEGLPAPVAAAAAGLPALPEDLAGYTGLEGLDPNTYIIPRMRIVQPTSKEGTAGNFRMNLTGEEFVSLRVVGVKAEAGRVLWDRDGGGQEPICKSNDGFFPAEDVTEPVCSACLEVVKLKGGREMSRPVCPKAQWGEDHARPECDATYNLLCLNAEDDLPFWLTLSGTSISAFRRFVSAIHLRRRKLFEYEVEISLDQKAGDKGKYFVAKFSAPKQVSREFLRHIIEIVQNLRHETVARTFEAEFAAGVAVSEADSEEAAGAESMPGWMK